VISYALTTDGRVQTSPIDIGTRLVASTSTLTKTRGPRRDLGLVETNFISYEGPSTGALGRFETRVLASDGTPDAKYRHDSMQAAVARHIECVRHLWPDETMLATDLGPEAQEHYADRFKPRSTASPEEVARLGVVLEELQQR
jgi:hypothetical protein